MTQTQPVETIPTARPTPAAVPTTGQPYEYRRAPLVEPDWTRFPGWRHVTREQWESAQWQRVNCVKNIKQLRAVLGDLVDDTFYDDLAADQATHATMSMLVPPQMLNTMVPFAPVTTDAFYADPVRRYMIPVASDRRTDWPSHPYATRDSLHEHDMWVAEGLTHRYPTKVLAELLSTCPQYCGHCTRMDLVGNSTPTVDKLKLTLKPVDRYDAHITYLKAHPGSATSSSPAETSPTCPGRTSRATSCGCSRSRPSATSGSPPRRSWACRSTGSSPTSSRASNASPARPPAAASTSRSTRTSTTPSRSPRWSPAPPRPRSTSASATSATRASSCAASTPSKDLLDLCFALQGEAGILPYYFYMCDMIPNAEHWRVPVWHAQQLQHDIMGYLPGYATPRIVCDVPFVGKRWVHMLTEYDRERGISYWTKNYRTSIESADLEALNKRYAYYDPIDTLPESGQAWWAAHRDD